MASSGMKGVDFLDDLSVSSALEKSRKKENTRLEMAARQLMPPLFLLPISVQDCCYPLINIELNSK